MVRTPSAVSAATLTRAVRAVRHNRPRPARSARLRLDTLEPREQPGSVLSGLGVGLGGGGMLEPIQVMAAVLGPDALARDLAPPAPTTRPAPAAAPSLTLTDLFPSRPLSPEPAPTTGGTTATGSAPASATRPAGLDLGDLATVIDPSKFNPPAIPPAAGTGGTSNGGGGTGPAAAPMAGSPPTDGTAPSAGRPAGPNDPGLSVTSPAASPASPGPLAPGGSPSVTGSSSAAAPTSTALNSAVFVTPPTDGPALEPAAPTQTRTAPVRTTTSPLFAVGTDAGARAQVKVYDAATRHLLFNLHPFPNTFTGGARVAVADVTGDGQADVIAAEGPGGANLVRVYDGLTGNPLAGTLGSFAAFPTAQASGVWVAAGDVTGDGKADVIVGADGNVAAQAKVFSGADGSVARTLDLSALPLGGGVRVASGDLNGDGQAEVIVGSGPGAVSRVGAFDGATGKALYDFFPFGPADRSGVTLAAGDVTGDSYDDLIVGQATGGAMAKVFSGTTTASVWNLDAFPGTTGGVRVGAVDADADGVLDVLAGKGPGGGEAGAYAGAGGAQLFALSPFGTSFAAGTFVAGDSRPVAVVRPFTVTPTLTISVNKAAVPENGGTWQFTLTRDDTSTSLAAGITLSGTATGGQDYTSYSTGAFFSIGQATWTFPVMPSVDDTKAEGPETVVATITPSASYTVGSPGSATVLILDDDGPDLVAPVGAALGDCADPYQDAPGTPPNVILPTRPGQDTSGIAQADPAYLPPEWADWLDEAIAATGVGSNGQLTLGTCPPWADFAFTNQYRVADGAGGNSRSLPDLPELEEVGGLVYVVRCTGGEYFNTPTTGNQCQPVYPTVNTLIHNSTTHRYTFTDSTGTTFIFADFDISWPAAERGKLLGQTDPGGNVVVSATYDASGNLTALARPVTTGGTTTTTKSAFTYLTSGSNAGKVDTITLTEQVGAGTPTTVRTAALAYYDGSTGNGTLGDLKSVAIADAGSALLETHYFRYYTAATFDGNGTQIGYAGGLKYQVTGAAYDRMKAWADANSTTVDALTDAQVADFADTYLEYDAVRRVTRMDVQGGGCSACSGGIGSYSYGYETSPFADGYNSWRTRRTEGRPDGSARVTYWNYAGEPVLAVHQEGGQEWCTYYRYDSDGRLALVAAPSAVSGYDESYADLLHNQSGNYQYLRDGQGAIGTLSYYTSTTADSTTPGGAAGYLDQTALQRGESGTGVLQGTTEYFTRTVSGVTVYPVADATVYRNDDGTGGQTTSYAWTWNTGSLLPASMTVTLPAVTTGQNGPGTATSATVVADGYGRPVWSKDAAGFLTYVAYDDATGAATKVIRDVDTTQTGDFSNLPSGWSTPTGGGLHLTTTYEVDALGRTTKETSPAGNVTYTVYNDADHEVRVYPGWDATNNVPTGPTRVYREDRARGYAEALTMSATPTVSSGRPTGAESISNVQSLSRQVLNDAGQVVYADQYITLSGTSYSQSSVTLGTAGTNYLRTEYSYDHLGRLNRTVTPSGTIYRTVFDGQGREVSQWVGTNDTPGTGYWSPTNNTSPSNMVMVSENEYDAGGVGDGLLTKVTEHPGGGAADRVTAMSYDWRDRPVATKSGVETTESTSLNRPISYRVLDNLGEVTESYQYDGDGLSITTDSNSDGVPDQPSSSALRAKSTASYDELGQVYQEKTFSVDPSTGTVSTSALTTDHWFDSRGEEIKTAMPGGEVDKAAFDGAGRLTTSYVTDGGGDSGYADAASVTGDAVLDQAEAAYDADGNPILATTRERFHDETTTGALGDPSAAPKARVSYQAGYFDPADRPTDTVDVGTNGGSAYTRPSSVPSRSDTTLVTSYGYNSAGWLETTTDPRGLVGKQYFDLAGRTTKTIENYVDGMVSDADDKTVEYTYDASSQMATLKADLTGGGYQETEWVYGITSPVVSNDVLKEMRYPDPSTGAASSSEKDSYTYNQLGQVLTKTDRNGTVHTYTYDVLGRVTSDAVTTLGTGVDGAVRRIETAYDGQGNAYLITSYDSATSGNVVNQVQREFNGLGQLTREWQATNGAVNTSTTPSVQYGYSFAPSGSTNHSRLTSITYPNGRVITYNYATGLADAISRLSSITDGTTTLESYDYLGLGTVVKRGHPQTGIDLTYEKLSGESNGDAGDQYAGLDRFGRVVDQRWTTSAGTVADRRQYGYDRDSNRLYADNLDSSSNSEVYAYDGLNQLTSFQRGTLNGTKDGISGTPSRSQSWDFDAVGNFDSQTTDGTAQTRSANKQNEITSISGATTPTYDSNGNLTTDETGRTFKYDAWNRLVEVRDSSNTLLATYRYDALGRRVREVRGSTTTDLYYSTAWQVLEERLDGTATASYVWSPVYVDALVCRDRDTDGNGSLDERLYPMQDVNWNVVGLLSTSGTVVERDADDAYGTFTVLDGSWNTRTGSQYDWGYHFQCMRYDAAAGDYNQRNREYSPTLGQWLQTDPSGFQSKRLSHKGGTAG